MNIPSDIEPTTKTFDIRHTLRIRLIYYIPTYYYNIRAQIKDHTQLYECILRCIRTGDGCYIQRDEREKKLRRG